jgi:DNA-binding LacI/PurR family transcriptional regulator
MLQRCRARWMMEPPGRHHHSLCFSACGACSTGVTALETNDGGREPARPAGKQEAILAELRARIIDRSHPPGSRLPTRSALQRRYDASSNTIQRALDRLIADGFAVARGRHGTFVVEHPPHTSHYGLLFPLQRGAPGWVRFWTALVNEAHVLSRGGAPTVSVYFGLDEPHDSPSHQRLARDIAAQRFAGLVFASTPFNLLGTPALTAPGLARAAIMTGREQPDLIPLVLDQRGFIDQALDHFKARGRTRVAVLCAAGQTSAWLRRWHEGLAARGLRTRPYWVQSFDPASPAGAQGVAHLLMQPNQLERPDALLISDDNLVDPACAGLVAAGLRVPDDCTVVAHCNFPWPAPGTLPVRRLGYDARRLLGEAIAAIERRRAGGPAGEQVTIPAQFEDELARRPPVLSR